MHTILKKVSPEDVVTLGLSEDFAQPDWMVLTVLPVPPPQVRPGVTEFGSGVGPALIILTLACGGANYRHGVNECPGSG